MSEPLVEVSMDGIEWRVPGTGYTLADLLFSKEMYRYERQDGVVVRAPPADVPLKEYVRFGQKSGPGVYQNVDRWGQPEDSYTAHDWYCIEPERWAQIKAWQAPLSTDAEAMLRKGASMEEVMRVAGGEIQARFDLAGCRSTIWQLDIPHRPDNRWDDQRRIVSLLGIESDRGYREWTWYECFVGHPLSLIKAGLMNMEAENRRDLTTPRE